MLQIDYDKRVPSLSMFGDRVYNDATLFFRNVVEPEKVLVRLCKIAKTLKLYRDSYASDECDDDKSVASIDSNRSGNENVDHDNDFKAYVKSNSPQFKGVTKKNPCKRKGLSKPILDKVTTKVIPNSVSTPAVQNSTLTSLKSSEHQSLNREELQSLKREELHFTQSPDTDSWGKQYVNNGKLTQYSTIITNDSTKVNTDWKSEFLSHQSILSHPSNKQVCYL